MDILTFWLFCCLKYSCIFLKFTRHPSQYSSSILGRHWICMNCKERGCIKCLKSKIYCQIQFFLSLNCLLTCTVGTCRQRQCNNKSWLSIIGVMLEPSYSVNNQRVCHSYVFYIKLYYNFSINATPYLIVLCMSVFTALWKK